MNKKMAENCRFFSFSVMFKAAVVSVFAHILPCMHFSEQWQQLQFAVDNCQGGGMFAPFWGLLTLLRRNRAIARYRSNSIAISRDTGPLSP